MFSFNFNPYQKILFSLFAFFMSGMLSGIAAYNADLEGFTTQTMIYLGCAVAAIIISVFYLVTVFGTVEIEDKLKKIIKDLDDVPSKDGVNVKE